MHFAAKLNQLGLNEIPKPLWILAMILGFMWFWPVGLGIALMLGGGYFGSGRCHGRGRWMYVDQNGQPTKPNPNPGPNHGMGWGKWGGGPAAPQSGNQAFDDYRTATLRRLEDEQKEFVEYLERLRQAKDKAEFDQFMADRRRPPMQQDPFQAN